MSDTPNTPANAGKADQPLIRSLATALYDDDRTSICWEGCTSRDRDTFVFEDIIRKWAASLPSFTVNGNPSADTAKVLAEMVSLAHSSELQQAIERDREERDASDYYSAWLDLARHNIELNKQLAQREAVSSARAKALADAKKRADICEAKLNEREAELAEVKTRLQDCETTLGLNMLERENIKEGLKFIHEIAYEKCRTGEDDGNCASIEAIARGCLGLKADDGFENIPNLQAKLAEQSAALASANESMKAAKGFLNYHCPVRSTQEIAKLEKSIAQIGALTDVTKPKIQINSGIMKILIRKCTDSCAWYAPLVGKTIPVIRVEENMDPSQGIPEDVYWCREPGRFNCLNYVRKSDAIEVQESSS